MNNLPTYLIALTDPSISVFVESTRCGVKNGKGDIVLVSNDFSSTNDLKDYYKYQVCMDKKTKKPYLFVEPEINAPYLISLNQV